MKKIIRAIRNPRQYLLVVVRRLVHVLPQNIYLELLFYLSVGYRLNLKRPRSFNEKLQWLKLHRHVDRDSLLVDKFEVKSILGEMIGEEYIVPTYGIYTKFDEIDFTALPDKFVIKTTHQSGGVVVCTDKAKLDIPLARKTINDKLQKNLYYWGLEWPYKKVPPRIIVEEYIGNGEDIKDYKLMCFNGRFRCSFVCSERNSRSGLKVDFYDETWSLMPFTRHYPNSGVLTPKPVNYERMIAIAEKVSAGIPFLRVDFFEVEGKLYIGELTFYPGCGFEEFNPREWDYVLGDWIDLNV